MREAKGVRLKSRRAMSRRGKLGALVGWNAPHTRSLRPPAPSGRERGGYYYACLVVDRRPSRLEVAVEIFPSRGASPSLSMISGDELAWRGAWKMGNGGAEWPATSSHSTGAMQPNATNAGLKLDACARVSNREATSVSLWADGLGHW